MAADEQTEAVSWLGRPREYGEYLASLRTTPLTEEQVETAARILAAVPRTSEEDSPAA
ncbi:hypothetical protein [Nocardioides speluncae]|uniref:hypothetical protein n=1 Tax=Nocardioides speluncae TaxID=2670337 RepID=UPI0012B175EF|nr:hypothetical protein [Nocardioides speluncae]